MTTPTPPGTAYLNARALLENPRDRRHGDESFVTLDAIILCAYPIRGIQLLCSLSYKKKIESERVRVGIYDIYAKVVTFKPKTHDSSPAHRDTEFNLMGDILHLFRVSGGRPHATVMYLCGKVCGTQPDIRTFTVNVQQIIRWAAIDTSLNIRGIMGMRPMWPPLDQHIPVSNSVVSFTGVLVGYDSNIALLALDDVCYLPHPGEGLKVFKRAVPFSKTGSTDCTMTTSCHWLSFCYGDPRKLPTAVFGGYKDVTR
ncbi:hypothetical protein EDB85DRAFT_1889628 [Lactarius pseudohatsudake]|nr:hypothetical protein EDB85DRAFT_1889628 [Lactarius pseudohatsudake]